MCSVTMTPETLPAIFQLKVAAVPNLSTGSRCFTEHSNDRKLCDQSEEFGFVEQYCTQRLRVLCMNSIFAPVNINSHNVFVVLIHIWSYQIGDHAIINVDWPT